jgi:hypothetical protein
MFLQWYLRGILRAPEDDPGGGGGGGKTTFTQEDVNSFLAKERKKIEAKFGDYDELKRTAAQVDELRKKAGQVDELTTRMAALEEEKDLAGKSAEEKERARAEKAQKKILDDLAVAARERDEAKAALEAERGAHRTTRSRTKLGSALAAADVFPQAAEDALNALMRETEIEWDDKGDFANVTFNGDGTRYAPGELSKLAESFLKTKPYYAKGAPSGGGTKRPSGGSGGPGADTRKLYELSSDELIALANQSQS